MSSRASSPAPVKQTGVILIMMVVVAVLAFFSYIVAKQSLDEIKSKRQLKTQNALAIAKKAIIGFALTRSDMPEPFVSSEQKAVFGYLPCPGNDNGDGNSLGNCVTKKRNYVGWFPWKSLGLPPLKDGNGDCLLYAVSSSYKFSPNVDLLNDDTFGMLQVVNEVGIVTQGLSASDRPVAIIFSAGQVLPGQVREKDGSECGNDENNFDAYLDTYEVSDGVFINNADVDSDEDKVDQFVTSSTFGGSDTLNDQFLVVSRDEIWSPIMNSQYFDDSNDLSTNKIRRVTEALARCLATYANNMKDYRLPVPVKRDLSGADYRDNASYVDSSVDEVFFGRYPFITENSDNILTLSEVEYGIGVLATTLGSNLFDKDFLIGESCNSLTLSLPGGGVAANLRDADAEERRLWNNWKDHIFYTVSKNYEPDDSAGIPAPCIGSNSSNCVRGRQGGVPTKFAGAVIFSGAKLIVDGVQQVRESPIADIDIGIVSDTKKDMAANYIELVLPSDNGKANLNPKAGSNDLVFCLTDTNPIDVVECD